VFRRRAWPLGPIAITFVIQKTETRRLVPNPRSSHFPSFQMVRKRPAAQHDLWLVPGTRERGCRHIARTWINPYSVSCHFANRMLGTAVSGLRSCVCGPSRTAEAHNGMPTLVRQPSSTSSASASMRVAQEPISGSNIRSHVALIARVDRAKNRVSAYASSVSRARPLCVHTPRIRVSSQPEDR
jgi:hypothetical protein